MIIVREHILNEGSGIENQGSGKNLPVNIQKLLIWQKAMDLVVLVYKETEKLPKEEQFGLQSQMRKSAVSIPSNIAEGYGRSNTGDYVRFIDIAMGSLRELETQVEISKRLGYFESPQLVDLQDQVGKLLFVTRRKLKENRDGQS